MEEEGLGALAKWIAKSKEYGGMAADVVKNNPKTAAAGAALGIGNAVYEHKKKEEEEHPLKHLLAKYGIG